MIIDQQVSYHRYCRIVRKWIYLLFFHEDSNRMLAHDLGHRTVHLRTQEFDGIDHLGLLQEESRPYRFMRRMQGTARLRLRTHRRLQEQRLPHQMQRMPHTLLQFRDGHENERGLEQLQADDNPPSRKIPQDLPMRSFHREGLSTAFAAYLQRSSDRASWTDPVGTVVLNDVRHCLLGLQQHTCFLIAPLRDHDRRIARPYMMVTEIGILALTDHRYVHIYQTTGVLMNSLIFLINIHSLQIL